MISAAHSRSPQATMADTHLPSQMVPPPLTTCPSPPLTFPPQSTNYPPHTPALPFLTSAPPSISPLPSISLGIITLPNGSSCALVRHNHSVVSLPLPGGSSPSDANLTFAPSALVPPADCLPKLSFSAAISPAATAAPEMLTFFFPLPRVTFLLPNPSGFTQLQSSSTPFGSGIEDTPAPASDLVTALAGSVSQSIASPATLDVIPHHQALVISAIGNGFLASDIIIGPADSIKAQASSAPVLVSALVNVFDPPSLPAASSRIYDIVSDFDPHSLNAAAEIIETHSAADLAVVPFAPHSHDVLVVVVNQSASNVGIKSSPSVPLPAVNGPSVSIHPAGIAPKSGCSFSATVKWTIGVISGPVIPFNQLPTVPNSSAQPINVDKDGVT